jgi:hypothetical protein
MTEEHDDDASLAAHQQHMSRLKRLLRRMPRRGNIHRYPGLKWIAEFAKKRMYLWSLRPREVTPALYVGTIVSFLPIPGLQIPVALVCALVLRANLPIFIALQFLSNWLTSIPIFFACHEVGRLMLKIVDVDVDALDIAQLRAFVDNAMQLHWAANGHALLRVMGVMSLGALILGSFTGGVLDFLYRFMNRRAIRLIARVKLIRQKRAAAKDRNAPDPPPAPRS